MSCRCPPVRHLHGGQQWGQRRFGDDETQIRRERGGNAFVAGDGAATRSLHPLQQSGKPVGVGRRIQRIEVEDVLVGRFIRSQNTQGTALGNPVQELPQALVPRARRGSRFLEFRGRCAPHCRQP